MDFQLNITTPYLQQKIENGHTTNCSVIEFALFNKMCVVYGNSIVKLISKILQHIRHVIETNSTSPLNSKNGYPRCEKPPLPGVDGAEEAPDARPSRKATEGGEEEEGLDIDFPAAERENPPLLLPPVLQDLPGRGEERGTREGGAEGAGRHPAAEADFGE